MLFLALTNVQNTFSYQTAYRYSSVNAQAEESSNQLFYLSKMSFFPDARFYADSNNQPTNCTAIGGLYTVPSHKSVNIFLVHATSGYFLRISRNLFMSILLRFLLWASLSTCFRSQHMAKRQLPWIVSIGLSFYKPMYSVMWTYQFLSFSYEARRLW